MTTTIRNLVSILIAFWLFQAQVAAAPPATTPTVPEYGFRGLKRVEVVFVNGGPQGVAGGVVPAEGGASPQPADDLSTKDLNKEPECKAIGKALGNAGLEIVEHCKPDDLACAQLYLIVEDHSTSRAGDRVYLIGAELSQRVKLARDKKVELAMPSTWSAHRVAVVPPANSATTATCIDFRALATWFGSSWRVANK